MTETTAAERARPRTFPNATPRPEGELAALERIWDRPRGIHAITAVNNSIIGLLYIGTAFLFFLLAGILALVMRTQLAQPNAEIVGHTLYNQLFTMHGTVMMFLFAVPSKPSRSCSFPTCRPPAICPSHGSRPMRFGPMPSAGSRSSRASSSGWRRWAAGSCTRR